MLRRRREAVVASDLLTDQIRRKKKLTKVLLLISSTKERSSRHRLDSSLDVANLQSRSEPRCLRSTKKRRRRLAVLIPPRSPVLMPPPLSRRFRSLVRSSPEYAPSQIQARVKIEQPKLIGGVSRRDAISLASATLLSNLIASDAAEARRIKPETRKKIREKLDKLREKGGITKEKTNLDAGDKEPEPFSPLNSLSIPLVEASV